LQVAKLGTLEEEKKKKDLKYPWQKKKRHHPIHVPSWAAEVLER